MRLRFKLAAGLGESWCRDVGIPQGCPLSMVFIVALFVTLGVVIWMLCLVLNLNCMLIILNVVLFRPRALFESAYFTARYVRSVCQDVSPANYVLLSTSKSVRRAMKLWDISGEGGFWKVQFDVGDLGGVILISRIVLELVLFLVGLVRLLLDGFGFPSLL